MLMPTRVHRFFIQDPIDAVNRDLGQIVDKFFNGSGDEPKGSAIYAANVREDADHFYVEAELPGFRKEDVEVTLEKSTLTITAERKDDALTESKQGETHQWLLRERQAAAYQRTFTLPPTVSEGEVDAKLVDGVLQITLNKREESKPRKIQVS